ncbi:Espin (Autosomal recessive deafness type 36 protein) (Ectoplasmic specialization protein) [Durusdinium trenchii]|uniref:Espin (Autosomal recessive deafness type 36 protein) (Ectoplasmic specialization protein) n=1 Tax=Durusdinium trenchii TaxID=1381693 RepID=A0ABP0PME5_9DINO
MSASTCDALEAALRAVSEVATPRTSAVEGVPGAFVVHGVLSAKDCEALGRVVDLAHAAVVLPDTTEPRRESQHHIPVWVDQAALKPLCRKLHAALPQTAGPRCAAQLEEPGLEVSHFTRLYKYEQGDFSAPHFDRAYHERDERGRLTRFSAFSIVLYLNDDFEGGSTTFFAKDPLVRPSRRGNTPVVDPTRLRVQARVTPRRGDALIFPHGNFPGCHPNPLHEGSVVVRGSKSILRSDIMFRPAEKCALPPPTSKRREGKPKAGSAAQLAIAEQVEAILNARLSQIAPEFADEASGSILVAREAGGPEMRCDLANKVFWKAFADESRRRRQRGEDKVAAFSSDLGLTRELTRVELAELIVASLPDDHPLAFVGVTSGASIVLNSKLHRLQMHEAQMIMCETCGKFLRSSGGLEWHMKRVHKVATHSQAFEAVQRASTAVTKPASVLVWPVVQPKAAPLDRRDFQTAVEDPEHLQAAIAQGKVRSLGPGLDACRAGDLETLKDLISQGAFDPREDRDRNGCTGLLWACGFGHLKLVRFLVDDCHVDPESPQLARRGLAGRKPLHWAARNGQLAVVRYLVEQVHATVDPETSDGTTPLCLAAYQGHLETCRYLRGAGANVLTVNSFGCNLAMWIAQGVDRVDVAEWALGLGVNFDAINHNGQGPLHKAAQRGNARLVNWLVSKVGPHHHLPNAAEQSTPAQLAEFSGHCDLAKVLRQASGLAEHRRPGLG